MNKIIYTDSGGSLVIVHIAPEMLDKNSATRELLDKSGALAKDATSSVVMDYIKSRMIPADAVGVSEIDETKIPQDRTYRDAWEDDGIGGIVHNMPKSRNIHRELMRIARAPKLAVLDVDYMRADEAGDVAAKASISAQKQALRDVTAMPEIDAAATVEELATVWPSILL